MALYTGHPAAIRIARDLCAVRVHTEQVAPLSLSMPFLGHAYTDSCPPPARVRVYSLEKDWAPLRSRGKQSYGKAESEGGKFSVHRQAPCTFGLRSGVGSPVSFYSPHVK